MIMIVLFLPFLGKGGLLAAAIIAAALVGAPLFVLLLLASVALEFFVPASMAPSKATRAIVVFTLFTAAYMAEIVRGGEFTDARPGTILRSGRDTTNPSME